MNRSAVLFLDFLSNRNLLDAYFSSLSHVLDSAEFRRDFVFELLDGNPVNYINNAFSWSDSAQGYKFWQAIDDAWLSFLNKISNDKSYSL